MTDDDNSLRHAEIDHTNLNIPVYKKGEPPTATPTFVMTVDNFSGQVIAWRLEWSQHLPVGAVSFGAFQHFSRHFSLVKLLPGYIMGGKILCGNLREISSNSRSGSSIGKLPNVKNPAGILIPSPTLR